MSAEKRLLTRTVWLWVAPAVGVAALGLSLYFFLHTPREKSYRLRMTAGDAHSTRQNLAQVFKGEAARYGIVLDLETTAGSDEALQKVNNHTLDLAFVQGGLIGDSRVNVRQVATLHVEPLHLLVKKELAEPATPSLTALDGKTVNLGPVGSGSNLLSSAVLQFVGLQPRRPDRKGGYVVSTLNRDALFAADRERLPDAIFEVSSLPSELAKHLVTQHEYRLIPLPFADAFGLDGLTNPATSVVNSAQPDRIDNGRTCATVIPAYTYSVDPPVPPAPLPALGTRLLVVANKDVDTEAVRQVVTAIYTTEFAKSTRPPLDDKLLELPPEFAWHRGAQLYQERNAPVVSGNLMDAAQKGFAILAATASGLFVLWQWLKLRSQFMRDKGFNKYIGEVTNIEEQVTRLERDPAVGREQLVALRDTLGRLKNEALNRFTEGELAGNELMQGFLIQVNDVRDNVTRLLQQPSSQAG